MDNNNGTTMLVTPAGTAGGMGGLFGGLGGNGGIEGLIFLVVIAALFGGGFGNWGGRNGGSSLGDAAAIMAMGNMGGGAQPNYVLTSDFASVERKLDLVQEQLCRDNATQLTTQYQQHAAVIDGMHTGFNAAELAASNRMQNLMGQIYDQNMQNLRQNCDLTHQISDGFAQVGYQMAQQGCETRNAMCQNTRDIIDNQNAGYRAILERMTQSELNALRDQNTELRSQIANANLMASQAAQTSRLQTFVADQFQLYNPRPVPSFPVPVPYQFGGLGFAA